MCGIAGFFSKGPFEGFESNWIGNMLDVISYRGPDESDFVADNKRGIALGANRLALVDLVTGRQPLVSDTSSDTTFLTSETAKNDQSLFLAVNGEFYGFKALRASLMARGYTFRTKSDSEIVFGLYREYGLDFVQHLRGEFALALYDAEEDKLILARDRFGVRPMFFHLAPSKIIFASEIKALFQHPDNISRELCHRQVLNQMMEVMVPGETPFVGIHSLEPGHMLIVRRVKGKSLDVTTHKYWDFEFPTAEERADTSVDDSEMVERVRDELIDAVNVRMDADVPVGCYLSGGIDSCAVLGLMTGVSQSPIHSFTIGFDDPDYDEAPIAQEMAHSMRSEHTSTRLRGGDIYGPNFVDAVWHAERAFYNAYGVAKFSLSKKASEHGFKTVMTGEGADELFSGYPALKREMFRFGPEASKRRAQYEATMLQSNDLFRGAIIADTEESHPAFDRVCGFTPAWIHPWIGSLRLGRELLSGDLLKSLGDYDPIEAIVEKFDVNMLKGRHPLDCAQYTWAKTQLEGQILQWAGDRMDMAHAVESRVPFLDHHLAELATKVPPHLRVKGTTEKWILREAVKGVLPERLQKREKFAFMAPPSHSDRDKQVSSNKLVSEYLSKDALCDSGLFDPSKVKSFLSRYKGEKSAVVQRQMDTILCHVLGLQILHRRFIKDFPAPRA